MNYIKGILSGLAAIFVAEFVFFWPTLSGEKATGLAVLKALLVESVLSPRFWIVSVLLFGLFFAAGRGSTSLRVLFFWIPTLTVLAFGFSIVAMYAYLFTNAARRQRAESVAPKVIVRVYRDRESDFANELDHKLYGLNNERHTTASGKLIWVATVEPYKYRDELSGKIAMIKPQMIVLDSPTDAKLIRGLDFNLNQAANVCGDNRTCPAFIPSWVSGEELEAAKLVLAEVATDHR